MGDALAGENESKPGDELTDKSVDRDVNEIECLDLNRFACRIFFECAIFNLSKRFGKLIEYNLTEKLAKILTQLVQLHVHLVRYA